MAEKRRPPGAPKGRPKPIKRPLDSGFPDRLRQAMADKKLAKPDGSPDVPGLARLAGCTRAVIHNYLKGGKPTIDAMLLFEIAECLDVSPAWLLKHSGPKARARDLRADQKKAIEILDSLDNRLRAFWLDQGEDLRRRDLGAGDVLVRQRDESRDHGRIPKVRGSAR